MKAGLLPELYSLGTAWREGNQLQLIEGPCSEAAAPPAVRWTSSPRLQTGVMDNEKRDSSPCRDSLAAGLLLAVLAVAAATAAAHRGARAAAPLRLFQPSMFPGAALSNLLPPACTASNLHGLIENGTITWGCGAASCNLTAPASNATPAAAQQPHWQAPSLQLSSCRLRRFTPEAARACLEGRSLVMIGDSLTRWGLVMLPSGLRTVMAGLQRLTEHCTHGPDLPHLQHAAAITTTYADSCTCHHPVVCRCHFAAMHLI